MRIISYNVHGWKDSSGNRLFDSTLQTMKTLDADIICLNEVIVRKQYPELKKLAKELKMHVKFINPYFSGYGNAILCKRPIKKFIMHKLPPDRALGIIELHNNSIYACTHLHHISESKRIAEFKLIEKHLNDFASGKNWILCGDLNALDVLDYNKQEWINIINERKRHNWEMPSTDLMNYIEEKYYVLGDATFTAHTEDPKYHIDYFIANWMPKYNYSVIDIYNSDHFPICLTHK